MTGYWSRSVCSAGRCRWSCTPGQVRIAGTASVPRVVDAVIGSRAALRERIAVEHDRFAETEAFAFFLDRVDTPESDLAAEWDAYVIHRGGRISARGTYDILLTIADREAAINSLLTDR